MPLIPLINRTATENCRFSFIAFHRAGIKALFALFSLFFLLTFPNRASAQYEEFGIMAGGSNYKGELSEHLFNTRFLHFAGGAFYRHNWDRRWSWKIEFNYGRVSGNDAYASNGYAIDRNLSFQSDIWEISPQVEFNFFAYETGRPDYPWTPYVFTGLSIFHFNPKAYFGNDLVELQPLGTEGQGYNGEKKYKRLVFAIPIGGGVKFNVGRIGIGIEIGARRAYTDYLDDVSTLYAEKAQLLAHSGPLAVIMSDRSFTGNDTSLTHPVPLWQKQRGDSTTPDWYLFGGITLYFRLTSMMKDICHPFRNRRY
ncbi:MAG: DUF6089 family protein [Bacteroidia bacterium]